MQAYHAALVFGALFSIYIISTIMPSSSPTFQDSGAVQTKAIVDKANAFLNLLDKDLRAEVQFPYEQQEYARPVKFPHPKMPKFSFVGEQYGQSVWSNFPVSDVPRPGIRMGNLTTPQRDAVMELLAVSLNDQGRSKVNDIMGSDEALARSGVPYAAGKAAYTLAFFGEPSVEDVWMLQLGGHHLALNLAVHRSEAVLAPILTGALPASYVDEDGLSVRALADENDKAFTLLHSLDETQLKQAIIDHDVEDVLLGPGEDGKVVEAAGVKASSLTPSQKTMLFDLIREWVFINDVHAGPRLEELRADLEDTFFAWSGPTTHDADKNGASYFRIQGSNIYIEFSPQGPGGDLRMHVHTIYRDARRAYGKHFNSGARHAGM